MIASPQEERELEPLALLRRVGEEVAHRFPEPQVVRVLRAEVVEATADDVRPLHLEDGASHLVRMNDDARGIEHDDPVLAGLHDLLGLRLLLEDDVDPAPFDRDRRLPGERVEKLPSIEGERPRRCR